MNGKEPNLTLSNQTGNNPNSQPVPHGWPINSIIEILQDGIFLKLMLKMISRMRDIEARHYLSMIVKFLIPIFAYETANSLEIMKIKSKKDLFYPGMSQRVKKERDVALKDMITTSSRTEETIKEMELNFSRKSYDIRIIVSNNQLLSLNFDEYHDKIVDQDFWDSMFDIPTTFLDAIVASCGFDIRVDDFFSALEKEITRCADLADKRYSATRYSYSSFTLFSRADNLTIEDKVFIMYRYRLLFSSLDLEKVLPHKVFLLDNGYKIDTYDYIRKYKAIIICLIGEELKQFSSSLTAHIKDGLEQRITDKRFYIINRKIRNNIHYTSTNKLSDEEIEIVDRYQNIYLEVVLQCFESCLFVNIDSKCAQITAFYNACTIKGIDKRRLRKYHQYYYIKFLLLNRV